MPPVGPIIEGAPVHGYEAIVLHFWGQRNPLPGAPGSDKGRPDLFNLQVCFADGQHLVGENLQLP